MGATLQALHTLQEIESQIVDIRRQLSRRQRQVRAQERRLRAARDTIEQKRAEVLHTRARFDELDVDIKGRSANIEKLREHLNTVRTNKEYAAVLAQLNNEKADVTRLENQALEIMQTVEARATELDEFVKTESTEAERLEELTAQHDQAVRSFSGRLDDLKQKRDEAAADMEGATIQLFDRLSERYDGEVLAEVERVNPRRDDFICAGCHMSLRVDVANMLKTRDDIVTCKSCGRILFMDRNT